jgi:hypothetical protein
MGSAVSMLLISSFIEGKVELRSLDSAHQNECGEAMEDFPTLFFIGSKDEKVNV